MIWLMTSRSPFHRSFHGLASAALAALDMAVPFREREYRLLAGEVAAVAAGPCDGLLRDNWFGCDDGGIDIASEVMLGRQVALIIGFAATLVPTVNGDGQGIIDMSYGVVVGIR